jgi:hypothetical protein
VHVAHHPVGHQPGLYPPNAENKARYDAWKAGPK